MIIITFPISLIATSPMTIYSYIYFLLVFLLLLPLLLLLPPLPQLLPLYPYQ